MASNGDHPAASFAAWPNRLCKSPRNSGKMQNSSERHGIYKLSDATAQKCAEPKRVPVLEGPEEKWHRHFPVILDMVRAPSSPV